MNLVCYEYEWADICMRVLTSQRLSKPNSRWLFTTFSNFFRLIKLYITRYHYEPCWNTEILAKLDKNCVIRFAVYVWSTFLITMLFFLWQCYFKRLLLKIWDNLQENTRAGTSFWIKIGLIWMLQLYLLKRTLQ